MKTTIDKAGRVVIPLDIRKKAGLRPGSELEVRLEDTGIRLVRRVPGPKVVRKGKRLVVVPTVSKDALPRVDVEALIETERDRWPLW